MSIVNLVHPDFNGQFIDWTKWRLTYEGGQSFINAYLKKFSTREDDADFAERKAITYSPSFAKTGINEIKDSIYERMCDITRAGGTKSYQEAILGLNSGVDLLGSSMNYFMGCEILPELLVLGKVGIYVDMPPKIGESIADNKFLRPYLYKFCCEDIKSWDFDSPNTFSSLLLQENVYKRDPETGLPTDTIQRYRHIWKESDNLIMVAFYDENGDKIDQYGNKTTEPIPLDLPFIPFVLLDISESLMTDIADYQIALLNLASSDMAYALKSNFPFYVEQFDRIGQANHLKKDEAGTEKVEDVKVGSSRGRRYSKNLERPGFIHPSPEPLRISMEKEEQLKAEIRLILKLTISNLRGPKMASAESKQEDYRSLESGLSYIGLCLEKAERQIAEFWSFYEGKQPDSTINYPENYSLRTDEDRQNEAEKLEKLISTIPSITFQKAIAKRIARIILGPKIGKDVADKIDKEIEASKLINIDYKKLASDIENGLVSAEFASEASLYPKGEADKAKEEQADRLARINEAQTNYEAARGNKDGDPIPNSGKLEKKKRQDPLTKNPVRGEGR